MKKYNKVGETVMEFKDKLKKLRTESNLSQEALADLVHVSRSAIAKYENGNGKPSEETLKLIADYFKVDVNCLEDDIETKETKRPLIGFIISIASGVIFIIAVTIASIFYNQMRLSVSFSNALKAMGMLVIIIVSLIVVGATSLVGYLLMTIKTGKKKLIPTLVSLTPLTIATTIGVSSIITTKIQYNDYKTFTKEKWISANNNHDYRGLLIYSFLEQFDITGYSELQVQELLGNPDSKNETNTWVYDLGYYKDYMDPTTFDIRFSEQNIVTSYDVVPH